MAGIDRVEFLAVETLGHERILRSNGEVYHREVAAMNAGGEGLDSRIEGLERQIGYQGSTIDCLRLATNNGYRSGFC